jgi:hypothetical protein
MAKKITGLNDAGSGLNINFDDGSSMAAQYTKTPAPNDNFQLLKNPTTGKMIQIGKQEFASLGQGLSDMGGYVPVGASEFLAPSVVGVSGAPKISEGSDEINDQATNLTNDLGKLDTKTDIDQGGVDLGAEFEALKAMGANINLTNDSELKQIEDAGTSAGSGFDSLIKDARDKARFGQAENVVATGRRGGFQRARFAGEAALGPTQGDVGYEGSGGKLEYSASAYQRNIDDLISQRNRAISLAKASAREAIAKGKEADFTRAKDILEYARKLKEDTETALQRQFDNEFKQKTYNLDVAKENRAAATSAQEQARLDARLNFDIASFNIGEERLNRSADLADDKFNLQLTETDRKNTREAIKDMANGLMDISKVDPKEITKLEIAAQLLPGTFEAFYDGLVRDVKNGDTIDDLKIEKAKADIANTYDTMKKRKAGGSGGGGGSSTVKLTNAQILKGAANAGMSVDDFKRLPIDQANEYVFGGSPEGVEQKAIAADISAIMGGDGRVDTAKYRDIINNIKTNSPDQLAWFKKTYPVKDYINPNDPTAADLLPKKDEAVQATLEELLSRY